MRKTDIVIVGDIAWNQDITPLGSKISPGGAAYYSAVGESSFNEKVGVVSQIGNLLNLRLKRRTASLSVTSFDVEHVAKHPNV